MAIEVRKGKNGNKYIPKVRDALGEWYEQKTFSIKQEAEKHERYLIGLKDSGTNATPAQIRNITLSDYWNVWSEQCRHRISEGWQQSQDEMWRNHVQPALGHVQLGNIKPLHILQLLKAMEGKGLKTQTQTHAYKLMHKMMKDACDHFDFPLINKNPVLSKYKPIVVQQERDYLKPNESRILLKASKDHFLGAAIWLGILAGLRPEAIQALTVRCVDFEKNQILLCAGFKRKVNRIEPYTKTKKLEYVPMPPMLADYLKPLLKNRTPDDFVALGKKGRMLDYKVFLKGLEKLCVENNLTVLTCHELRHSSTELWVEAGASQVYIGRMLGHAPNSSATKRYMHRGDDGHLIAIAKNVGLPGLT